MGKVFFAIVAVVASFIMVESLTCEKCSFNVLGLCVDRGNQNCTSVNSTCYTKIVNFTSATSKLDVTSMGCWEDKSNCTNTTTSTVLGIGYTSKVTCCDTDKCNTLTLNAAPATKMTFAAAVAGAILATASGYML